MGHFRLLAVGSNDPYHTAMAIAAAPVLRAMAEENGFEVDVTHDASAIHDENLAGYDAFLMLQLAPFDMTGEQQAALQRFVEGGRGWVGLHAAGLTGRDFVKEEPYWEWFEALMGGVSYSPHPAYQTGSVVVEDRSHPATRNLPERFEMADEWYEFDRSPRGAVRVLATADESTYRPNKPMGDHPVVWVNESYRRAIYIAVGHDASSLENGPFLTLLRDAILWAGSK